MRGLLAAAWSVAGVATIVVVLHHNGVWSAQSDQDQGDWGQGVDERLIDAAAMPEVSQAVIDTLMAGGVAASTVQVGSNRVISKQRLEEIIAVAAESTGLKKELIRAIVRTESDFRPGVISTAGAVGLMQVRPVAAVDAARRVSNRQAEWVKPFTERDIAQISQEDLLDPYINILLGSHYLAHLHERYSGYGEQMALWLALAAYNWGPGNVYRNLTSNPNMNALKDLRWLLNIRAPYETRAFIHRVLKRSGLRMETA